MKILDVKVDKITFEYALKKIEDMIEIGKKQSKTHQIVTVNPEFIMEAQKNTIFKEVLNSADLAVPDGAGILWAAKYYKEKLPERITGVDLVWEISKMAEDRGYSIFLLGGKEGIAQETGERLRVIHPRLKIAGVFGGSADPKMKDEIAEKIISTKPDILFVAYGFPKQDIWIARYKHELGVPVSMGVGGTFDFISGNVPRAPSWMQKIGIEWLYRLIKQPWRFRRIYTATVKFPWAVVSEKSKNQKS